MLLHSLRATVDGLIVRDLPAPCSPLLSWRCSELTSVEAREQLAASIARIERAAAPSVLPGSAPINRGAVRVHRDELDAIVDRLLLPEPVSARGVLLVRRLLADPAGPLFGTERAAELGERAAAGAATRSTGTPPGGCRGDADRPRADARGAAAANGLDVMKRAIVGTPMPSDAMEETLLRKTLALPIFASDPFSSVAYATESAMVVLVATSLAATRLVFPLSIAVSVLLVIVIASYRQTVRAYSTSGGSYVVSKENLGRIPSLVAAAALLVDYVLTVAVSVAAGILAITSAVPSLSGWTVELSIAAVVLITVVNLRGVRESGIAFAIPTYLFILAYLAMMGAGVGKCALGTCPVATTPDAIPAGAGAVTFFVLLRAFASGSAP